MARDLPSMVAAVDTSLHIIMDHLKIINICLVFFMLTPLRGQDYPFYGGFGDGFSSDSYEDDDSAFSVGGFGDGHAFSIWLDDNNLFSTGGFGDGHAFSSWLDDFNAFCSGGNGDGYAKSDFFDVFNVFCSGGAGDGYSAAAKENSLFDFSLGGIGDGYARAGLIDDVSIFSRGGIADGFAISKLGHIIYWTGTIGTGWNVSGNWENGIVPTHCNPVVIPSSASNFPAVNAGIFRIGHDVDDGDYNCLKIKVNNGAELTTRVNCFVENYGLIQNLGQIFVKNPASNAFTNMAGSQLVVKQGAQVLFQPN